MLVLVFKTLFTGQPISPSQHEFSPFPEVEPEVQLLTPRPFLYPKVDEQGAFIQGTQAGIVPGPKIGAFWVFTLWKFLEGRGCVRRRPEPLIIDLTSLRGVQALCLPPHPCIINRSSMKSVF